MSEVGLVTINENKNLEPIFGASPQQMIAVASQMATTLADVIKRQGLAIQIGQQYYVKVDGWAVLCSMMGLQPNEKTVIETSPGVWEAVVELINIKNGNIVARGSAICSCKERRWSTADDYARRSMAITRATGKACRLGLGWIMHMAGYASTPAEEMEMVEDNNLEKKCAGQNDQPPHDMRKSSLNTERKGESNGIHKNSNIKRVNPAQIISIFNELNVPVDRLEGFLGKSIDDVVETDVNKLRNAYNELRQGKSINDVLHYEIIEQKIVAAK